MGYPQAGMMMSNPTLLQTAMQQQSASGLTMCWGQTQCGPATMMPPLLLNERTELRPLTLEPQAFTMQPPYYNLLIGTTFTSGELTQQCGAQMENIMLTQQMQNDTARQEHKTIRFRWTDYSPKAQEDTQQRKNKTTAARTATTTAATAAAEAAEAAARTTTAAARTTTAAARTTTTTAREAAEAASITTAEAQTGCPNKWKVVSRTTKTRINPQMNKSVISSRPTQQSKSGKAVVVRKNDFAMVKQKQIFNKISGTQLVQMLTGKSEETEAKYVNKDLAHLVPKIKGNKEELERLKKLFLESYADSMNSCAKKIMDEHFDTESEAYDKLTHMIRSHLPGWTIHVGPRSVKIML